jgi:hypothetical protein
MIEATLAISAPPPPVTFDFTTAAVVSFVLTLLGMAAGLLLMLKFAGKNLDRSTN